MTDRTAELETLVDEIADHDVVSDAWLAKSFTDRLLVVDIEQDASFPTPIEEQLEVHDVYGYNEVYGTETANPSFAGDARDVTRHQFVDVQTTGDHQSYVVEK